MPPEASVLRPAATPYKRETTSVWNANFEQTQPQARQPPLPASNKMQPQLRDEWTNHIRGTKDAYSVDYDMLLLEEGKPTSRVHLHVGNRALCVASYPPLPLDSGVVCRACKLQPGHSSPARSNMPCHVYLGEALAGKLPRHRARTLIHLGALPLCLLLGSVKRSISSALT